MARCKQIIVVGKFFFYEKKQKNSLFYQSVPFNCVFKLFAAHATDIKRDESGNRPWSKQSNFHVHIYNIHVYMYIHNVYIYMYICT